MIAVNDVFVTKAWRESLGGNKNDNVHFLSDDSGKWRIDVETGLSLLL